LVSDATYINNLAKRADFSGTDDELGIYGLTIEQDEQGEVTQILGFQGSRVPIDVVDVALSNDIEGVLSVEPLT
jgi:hypothetical protein